MKKIIVLIGHNNSGKDTAADFIVLLLGDRYQVSRFALARYVKELAGDVFNIPYKALYCSSKERDAWTYRDTGKTARDCLKALAEAICDIDPTYHVREMTRRIDQDDDVEIAIVTDCRKVIEAKTLQETYGDKAIFLRLWRNAENIQSAHPSERDITSVEISDIGTNSFYEIHNEGLTKEETQNEIIEILAKEFA